MDENEIKEVAEVKEAKKKKKRRRRKKRMPVGKMVALDLMAIIFGLLVFALFHHVLDFWGIRLGEKTMEPIVVATLAPQPEESITPTVSPQEIESTPEPDAEPTPEPTPARIYSGMWGEKYADKFTEGEVIQTENSYKSENVSVTIEEYTEPGLVYFVADIYVSDLKYFGTAFANGEGNGDFNEGLARIDTISKRVNAIVAVCGDHYYGRREGLVVRNGTFWRDTHNEDVCVLYTDGRMETMTDDELDIDAIKEAHPWQVWSFGPALLDAEGHAKTFTDNQSNVLGVNAKNPRCAIGYYEPGHYCLVKVEGNRWGKFIGSYGMDFNELAAMFEKLGCKSAYNFDGGRSAAMSWMGEIFSTNYDRTISDIVYITDTPIESEPAESEVMESEG